jgi:predicted dehydrogenase
VPYVASDGAGQRTSRQGGKGRKVYGVDSGHIYNYDNYGSIKNDDTIDIVYVILPNHMHAGYTIRALEAGKHVLCEKPLAPTPADCQKMVDAAKANNRKLMTAYRLHYEPHHQTAIELSRKQAYGKIKLIEAITRKSPSGRSATWASTASTRRDISRDRSRSTRRRFAISRQTNRTSAKSPSHTRGR